MTLTELMRWRKDGTGPHGTAVLEALKKKLSTFNKLPTLPEAANRALSVAKDPNCSLRKLAVVIERDPALAAGILKLANSPLYRVGAAVESLTRAVIRLGLRECQNLIITVSMRSLFTGVGPTVRTRCEGLWRHSFFTACVARQLNRTLNLGFQGEEFACGISHDIGRFLLALGAPTQVEAADPLDFLEGPEVLDREREVLGTDHCFFGAWFANRQELPGSLVSAIQYHHTPAEAGDHQLLVGLIALADHMANFLQREPTPDLYDAASNPAFAFLAPLWEESRRDQYLAQARNVLANAMREVDEVVSFHAA